MNSFYLHIRPTPLRALATLLIAATSLLSLAIASPRAQASLGDDDSSIDLDQRHVEAQRRVATRSERYVLHELESGVGVVREYVNGRGIVFAVSWSGRAHPRLERILGRHYERYQSLAREQPRMPGFRSRHAVTSRDFVLERWGHMRKLEGRAYLPEQFPEGVTLDEIH